MLWNRYLAFYRTTLSDETFDITFAQLISNQHPIYCLLAGYKGVTVGRESIRFMTSELSRKAIV